MSNFSAQIMTELWILSKTWFCICHFNLVRVGMFNAVSSQIDWEYLDGTILSLHFNPSMSDFVAGRMVKSMVLIRLGKHSSICSGTGWQWINFVLHPPVWSLRTLAEAPQRRDSCRRGEDVPAAPVQEKIGHPTIFKLYLHKSEVDPQASVASVASWSRWRRRRWREGRGSRERRWRGRTPALCSPPSPCPPPGSCGGGGGRADQTDPCWFRRVSVKTDWQRELGIQIVQKKMETNWTDYLGIGKR